jgi:hypothetical protein
MARLRVQLIGWIKQWVKDDWWMVETYSKPDKIVFYDMWGVGPILKKTPAYSPMNYTESTLTEEGVRKYCPITVFSLA